MRTARLVVGVLLLTGCGDDGASSEAGQSSDETTSPSDGSGSGSGGASTSGNETPTASGTSTTDPAASTGTNDSPTDGSGAVGFDERCSGPEVIACWGFDAASQTDPFLNDSGFSAPRFDADVFAEGSGSIHMDVLAGSSADTSGSATLDFGDEVGPGESLYVQWRQRFSSSFLDSQFDANGWKQLLVHENTATAGCSDSEVVVTNSSNRNYPIVYHACNIFHAPRENPVDGNIYEFNYQPGGDNRCLYSWVNEDGLDFLEPTSDIEEMACVGFLPDQWLTFQLGIHINSWCTEANYDDCPEDSQFELWVAAEGEPPVKTLDWPVALRATTDPLITAYDSIQLTPYNTDKNSNQDHPPGEVWYDSVIVSRARIPDPN